MKKLFFVIVSLLLVYVCVFAENTAIIDLQKQFVRSSIAEKSNILPKAVTLGADGGKIFSEALNFVINNYNLLGPDDKDLYSLALKAAIDAYNFPDNNEIIPQLIKIFPLYNDISLHTAIFADFGKMKTYSVSAENLKLIINLINNYLNDKATLYKKNKNIELSSKDKLEIITALTTSGYIADSTFFDVLFTYIVDCPDEQIKAVASDSINQISGSYKERVIKILEQNSAAEKLLVYQLSVKNQKISSFFHAEIAEKALQTAINNIGDIKNAPQDLISLQLEAMRGIAKASWTKAASISARSFVISQQEFEFGRITEDVFVEYINCMQSLASTETSQALSSYLGVLNTKAEKNGEYSEKVMLAVISALGALGDKSAFDYLLAVTYLDYPKTIIEAARNALAGIKW